MLRRSYETVKLAQPRAVVVSGGLFGFEVDGPATLFGRRPCPTALASGAEYLCATYEMGLTHAGWRIGATPFDHVGQHLYIDQGGATSEEKLRAYLDDLRDAYRSYEGAETPKLTQVTEIGWSTATVSPQVQAENLLTAFDTFRGTGYVARAYWFHAQDIPEADLFFGLADVESSKKRSFGAFQAAAVAAAPERVGGHVARPARPLEKPGR